MTGEICGLTATGLPVAQAWSSRPLGRINDAVLPRPDRGSNWTLTRNSLRQRAPDSVILKTEISHRHRVE